MLVKNVEEEEEEEVKKDVEEIFREFGLILKKN